MIFTKDNLMVSYTSAREGLDSLTHEVEVLKACLPLTNVTEKITLSTKDIVENTATDELSKAATTTKNEGLKTSSKVQYVAQVGNFLQQDVPYHGTLQILKTILSYDYLWNQIRVKGGAYGCMCSFNRIGEGYFVSYRDPHLSSTLEVYQGVVDYLQNFDVDTREMTKFILGTMSSLDQPMNPNAKGERSMNLYMNRVSEEMIRAERAQILSATAEDIRNLLPVVEAILACKQICVVGGEDKIEEDRELFGEVRYLL